jgi:tungstate transport system substrate-binding protein
VRPLARALLAVALLVAAACESQPEEIILASTTSTEDSGLFDELIPAFETAHPEYRVRVVAVGTGQALELGRRGDADVLLVHAAYEELKFMEAGHGRERLDVMVNDFLLVGPEPNPAGIQSVDRPEQALRSIAQTASPFVSRGDDSGTHKKELALWGLARIGPAGAWYMEVGQGMADALRIASERDAYTLVDRATWLSMADAVDLVPIFEGAQEFYNPYAVITVANAANPDGADAFAEWLTEAEAQALISEFGVERFGRPLFRPNAMR